MSVDQQKATGLVKLKVFLKKGTTLTSIIVVSTCETPWCGGRPVCACALLSCTCGLCTGCKPALLSSDALQGNPVSRVTIAAAVIYPQQSCVRLPTRRDLQRAVIVSGRRRNTARVCTRCPCVSQRVCVCVYVCQWGGELEGRQA